LGDRDRKDHGSSTEQVKSSQDSILTNKKLDMKTHIYHPSYPGKLNWRISIHSDQGINVRHY
jgi:hypothetical protein